MNGPRAGVEETREQGGKRKEKSIPSVTLDKIGIGVFARLRQLYERANNTTHCVPVFGGNNDNNNNESWTIPDSDVWGFPI